MISILVGICLLFSGFLQGCFLAGNCDKDMMLSCFENATGLGTCEYIDKRYHCVKDHDCCIEQMPGFNEHKTHYGDEPFDMGSPLMFNGTCTFDWIEVTTSGHRYSCGA
mmetsp:Transcript_20970/g.39407  ORF Transcript_20970/g.39407 Transcript_20970/m.39407 type:complete len:109 (+) Transcript_20970:56-382(+)